MNYNELLIQIKEQGDGILLAENTIKSIEDKIKIKIENINNKFLSISIEDVLLSLPYKTFGSKSFAKKLNDKSKLYQDTQFNKIIRFLTLIEEIENDYNQSYLSLSKLYLTKPVKKQAEDLVSKYALIKNEYNLMNILINAIDSDKVLFNKTYNMLEDRGVFMAVYDKLNHHNLSTIATNMNTLVDQSYTMIESLNIISNELWESNNKLDNLNQSLKDINSSVKTGNFLLAVQTYQLYKINKNTRALNK
jgi:hypothetical protein